MTNTRSTERGCTSVHASQDISLFSIIRISLLIMRIYMLLTGLYIADA